MRRLPILLCALLVGWPASAAADVTAEMSAGPTEVPVGGQLEVEVRVKADSLDAPQIQLPEFEGFEVLRRSVSRPMQFNFGTGGRRVESQHIFSFALRAIHPGRHTLGPTLASQGGKQVESNTVVVTVGGAGATAPSAPQDAAQAEPAPSQAPATADPSGYISTAEVDPVGFIRAVADKPRPYVREQVTVTMYLYLRERLRAAPSIDLEPTTVGFWTHDLVDSAQLERVDRQVVGRTRYNVYLLRRFAAFPLKPGPATIGPIALSISRANVFDAFFGRGPKGPIERRGLPLELEVQPLPEGKADPSRILVGQVSVDARLDRSQVATGDAVTLTASVQGTGQLQVLSLDKPVIDGVDVFEPQVKDLIEAPNGTVGGTRAYEWLLVPRRPGRFEIPPMSVPTFDPETGRHGEARAPALTLVAAGQAGAADAEAPHAARAEDAADADAPPRDTLPALPPLRPRSALSRGHGEVSKRPHYPWAVGAAPALWLALLLLGVVRRRLAAQGADDGSPGEREIRSHLQAARAAAASQDTHATFAAIAAALQAAMARALGAPVGSHTRAELDRLLAERGLDAPIRKSVLDLLERCDYARFSPEPESGAALNEALQRATDLTRSLGQLPREEAA